MLEAAVEVFSASGFTGASMDEIATRAGISKPMVYAYLGTKEELFLACVRQAATWLMEAVVRTAQPGLPPDEQLWRGLRGFFEFVGAHRDGWRVLYRQARGQQPFAAEVALMRARLVEVVTGLLSRLIAASGRRHGENEVAVMAHALVGASESLADWLVDHPEEAPEATATRLMNFVWLGAGELLRGGRWLPPAN
ncbi:MAG TPA: TetR/AcrR family transcriptional regulator [Rugosimonospora sp.]|nr:TetR/AcrR family transcriptional regulator [Rugosimonospora sp.]